MPAVFPGNGNAFAGPVRSLPRSFLITCVLVRPSVRISSKEASPVDMSSSDRPRLRKAGSARGGGRSVGPSVRMDDRQTEVGIIVVSRSLETDTFIPM